MHIRQRKIIGALLVACTVAAATPALACGEVMYRMGSALRYQAFVSRHPANILVYSQGAAAQAAAAGRAELQRRLEQAGHSVTVVDNETALGLALATHAYDIVITSADKLPLVKATLADAARGPSLLPIVDAASSAALRQEYPQALSVDASPNRFLKGIERTMQVRGS